MTHRPVVDVVQMTQQDVKETLAVHLSAFDGYPNVRLGARYVTAFLSWFCAASDGVALVGKLDGKVAGYVVGAPLGYQAKLNRDLAPVVACAIAARPWLLLLSDMRGALWGRLKTLLGRPGSGLTTGLELPLPAPCMSLVGIGVAPRARKVGVGASLIAAFEAAARRRGMKSFRLSVYRNNVAACMLYERSGWQKLECGSGSTVYYGKRVAECG